MAVILVGPLLFLAVSISRNNAKLECHKKKLLLLFCLLFFISIRWLSAFLLLLLYIYVIRNMHLCIVWQTHNLLNMQKIVLWLKLKWKWNVKKKIIEKFFSFRKSCIISHDYRGAKQNKNPPINTCQPKINKLNTLSYHDSQLKRV
jgi:hypothetical protein